MKKKQVYRKSRIALAVSTDDRVVVDIRRLIESARSRVALYANTELTMLYWRVGERIRREILKEERAEYGVEILPTLSAKLEPLYGDGFSERNLARMVRFTDHFPDQQIIAALSQQLSWSHFVEILPVKYQLARGLKLMDTVIVRGSALSPPARGRGLKNKVAWFEI